MGERLTGARRRIMARVPAGLDPDDRGVAVWDLPVRLFHWSLVICIAGAVITAQIGEMDLHERFGVAVLVLVLFRVTWGVVGGQHARFASFVRGPGAAVRYLRGLGRGAQHAPGHSPIGGWSVLAMLVVFTVQATLGLFATDDIFFDGPLAGLVSTETSRTLTGLHHLNAKFVIALVVLHLVAVLVYLFVLRTNLILPMITGRARGLGGPEPARRGHPLLALALLVAVAAAVLGALYG